MVEVTATLMHPVKRLLSSMVRSAVLWLLVFIATLLYFCFSNPWYPSAQLLVSGKVSETPATVAINWTSGHGLNGYEMYRYALQSFPSGSVDSQIDVSLARTGERHGAAAGKEVILSKILIDGELYDPPSDALGSSITRDNDLLIFKNDRSRVSFSVRPKHHVRLEFLAFNYAGEVEVNFGGKVSRHFLYSPWDRNRWTRDSVVILDYWLVPPDGSFAVSMEMPRYPVKDVKISAKKELTDLALQLVTAGRQEVSVGNPIPTKDGAVFQVGELDGKRKRFFHPHRFIFQVIFALLTTWVLFGLITYAAKFQDLNDMLIARKRYLFWGMLFFCMTVFSFWHISFWPGIASTDSLKIWRAAHIPGMYLGDHPPLNVALYMYLSQIWDNMAVVPIAQNILTSLLIASMFFSMFRWGVPLMLLAPFFLLVVFSVPLGLYTATLWKDVPFALAIVYLGFRLADLYYRKRKGKVIISRQAWLVMILIVAALAGLRYNGAVYLILFPSLLVILGIVRLNKRFVMAGCLVICGTVFFSLISLYAGSSALSYFTMQTGTYFKQLEKNFSGEFVRERSVQYIGIFDINQTAMQWDHVGNCLYGRYDNNLLRRVRWNDVYPYLPLPRAKIQKNSARAAFAVYKKSYEKPWVYFSWNPVYMLLLLPVLPLFFRKLPMSAVFSVFILAEIIALVVIGIFNWRYYFFAHFAAYFLIPLVLADLMRKKQAQTT